MRILPYEVPTSEGAFLKSAPKKGESTPGASITPRCIVFEDEHLLVVNKPAGWNTHSPAPFAGLGIYEWLKHREPRWDRLAIIHRLDRDTSGLLVFGKTEVANRSLTAQFTDRSVGKRYVFHTDRDAGNIEGCHVSELVRDGERYRGRPATSDKPQAAITSFKVRTRAGRIVTVEASPLTGRTHQIRVHAAEAGFPILGDTLYGGTPFHRVCLHAESLSLAHPVSGERCHWEISVSFEEDPSVDLRNAIIEQVGTNSFRWLHGAGDCWPGWSADVWGRFVLAQSDGTVGRADWRDELIRRGSPRALEPQDTLGFYERVVERGGKSFPRAKRPLPMGSGETEEARWVSGAVAPDSWHALENGVRYEISFQEGASVGLFLDQRENRRRLLTRHVGAGFALDGSGNGGVLNCFSYTCAFSICAALAGWRATSVDLSKKYLEWGRRNFELNGVDPANHEFLVGDCFDWLKRLAKWRRQFDIVLLDPPTFSRSRRGGDFQVEADYERLVRGAVGVLRPGGVLFASTNLARLDPGEFLNGVRKAIVDAGRAVANELYVPQPPDFPITRESPGYLKTVWIRIR